jgi:hypothetical protein
MNLAFTLLSFALLGQASLPEMITDAISSPPGGSITGQPLTLLAALSSSADRRQQLEITHSYWRLAEAVGDYHFFWEYDKQLKRMRVQPAEAAALRTAQAASAASLLEAELTVVAAQYELAAMIRLPEGAMPPLPADPPHAGQYNTYFAELFANKAAPVQAKVIDRGLPIRLRAIEQHVAAVKAAGEAVASAQDAWDQRRSSFGDLISAMKEDLQQRQALMASICRYNWEIADYAMMVVPAGLSPQVLVARLIRSPQDASLPLGSGMDEGVKAAGLNEPTPAARPNRPNEPTPAIRPSKPNEPTPAVRPDRYSEPTPAVRPAVSNEPAPAVRPSVLNEPTPAMRPKTMDEPSLSPPLNLPDFGEPAQPLRPLVPVRPMDQ